MFEPQNASPLTLCFLLPLPFSEYEKKLVFDIIQPGGARVKQPDASLNEFCKAAESLSISLIGSLLVTKLELDVVWIMKAVRSSLLITKTSNFCLPRELCTPWKL